MQARRAWLLGAWLSFLLASMWFLAGAGGGPLGGPHLLHPASVEAWIRRSIENGPSPAVGAGFAALRLLTVALCAYLLVVTLASLLAHAVGWSRAAGFVDRRGPRVVSMLVRSSLGLTLSTAGLAVSAPAGAVSIVATASGPAHEGPLAAQGSDPTQERGGSSPSRGTTATVPKAPVLEWVRPTAPSPRARSGSGAASSQASGTASSTPSGPSAAAGPTPSPPPGAVVPSTWTVGPGDSFWSIARVILQRAWGYPPTDADVDPYWLALIGANRQALLHPDVPDLIYPGQTFVVPAPPAPDGSG